MPKGLRSYNKYIDYSNQIIEIIKLNVDSHESIDCFIGLSKNHEDVFLLCALHAYANSKLNAFLKFLVNKEPTNSDFYILKEEESISILLNFKNSYAMAFVTPILSCDFKLEETIIFPCHVVSNVFSYKLRLM